MGLQPVTNSAQRQIAPNGKQLHFTVLTFSKKAIATRFNPSVEVGQVEFFVGRVEIIVGQPKAEKDHRRPQRLLEDRGYRDGAAFS